MAIKDIYTYRREVLEKLNIEYDIEDITNFERWREKVLEGLLAIEGTTTKLIAEAIERWLDNHPEATTTVEDGTITKEKLDNAVKKEIESAKYRDNLLDAFNLVPSAQNILIEDNGVHLTYRDNIDTYFTLGLNTPVKDGKTYTLSFDCEGVQTGMEDIISFKVSGSKTGGGLFTLHNGRIATTFTMTADRDKTILVDDTNSTTTRPSNTDIRLTNFLLEEGEIASNYKPSVDLIANTIKRMAEENVSYKSSNGWAVGLTGGNHINAGVNLSRSLEKDPDYADLYGSIVFSKKVYVAFPMPLKEVYLNGATSTGDYMCCVDGLSSGADGSVGASFRLATPLDNTAWDSVLRLQISGMRADTPATPTVGYESSTGNQIVDIAKSYTNAYDKGRRFYYGENFFYLNGNRINDSQGRGMMECDTFAGLCLRGIRYEDSPYASSGSNIYANDEPNKTMTYGQMMQDTESLDLPSWAVALRQKFVSEKMMNLLNHEVRFAADNARLFWSLSGHMFTDITQARPGDLAFWRENGKPYFDGTTHVAIVGDDDDIYEVTGFQRSNGRYLHNIKFTNLKDHMPSYFVRPYGFAGE